ncbi:DUF3368 domain-containing protein [Clostridium kluyveri]|uniref:DUF3368 domain-containing protein n=1 Tax=Clostridium kluyveri TaxID=1534 RepID=A0A1L5F8H5_CLOKL|nr:DUF3368 domain-containing protein [Clostridium kluyveri]APM39289.1 hypothetical protein BS101_11310 [Clostridium kluyveri]
MIKVICNSSPIIGLSVIGKLLQSIGIIGVLIIAKKKGKIIELRNYLDSLIKANYRISKKLYENALRKVGELD